MKAGVLFPAAILVLLVSCQTGLALWGGDPEERLSHDTAASMLSSDGITISSSGSCSDRNRPKCTSLETIRRKCIDDLIWFKRISRCSVVVTGGTETGHASGTRSHWNGYKIDIRLSDCVNDFIETRLTDDGYRGDGAKLYRDSRGNVYAKERNHWDIQYV